MASTQYSEGRKGTKAKSTDLGISMSRNWELFLPGRMMERGKKIGSAWAQVNPRSAHTNSVTTEEASEPQFSLLLNRDGSSTCVVM